MTDTPHIRPTVATVSVFGWDRRWASRASIGAVLGVLVCAWFVWALLFDDFGDYGSSHRAVLTSLFGAFGLLFSGVAVTYALAAFDRQPVVTLDSRGVIDRRLSLEPLPWSELTALTPLQRGMTLFVLLHTPAAHRLPPPRNPLWRLNRVAARLLGNAELAVNVTSLDVDLPTFLDAIQSAAPTASDVPP